MKKAWSGIGVLGQGALAVVAVGGIFFGFRSLSQGDRGETGSGVLKPPPPVTAYRLVNSRARIQRVQGLVMPLPVLEYEIEMPARNDFSVPFEIWIVGENDQRIQLEGVPVGNGRTVRYGRIGYPVAPASPRLVIVDGGKVVFNTPVPPLPTPMGAIPLVVAISDAIELRATDLVDWKGRYPYPDKPYMWELHMPNRPVPDPRKRYQYPRIVRTEWPVNNLGYSFQDLPVYGFRSPDIGQIAEILDAKPLLREEEQEADLEIEIYDTGTDAGVRVLKPLVFTFSDQARVAFKAEVRKVGRSRQGKLSGSINLPVGITRGYAGLFLAPDLIQQHDLPLRPGKPMPKQGATATRIEIIAPNLGDLGISRVQMAGDDVVTVPTRPLAIGRHRLRIRVAHAVGVTDAKRHFVRMEPQSVRGSRNLSSPSHE
jgi:hypothetical protein